MDTDRHKKRDRSRERDEVVWWRLYLTLLIFLLTGGFAELQDGGGVEFVELVETSDVSTLGLQAELDGSGDEGVEVEPLTVLVLLLVQLSFHQAVPLTLALTLTVSSSLFALLLLPVRQVDDELGFVVVVHLALTPDQVVQVGLTGAFVVAGVAALQLAVFVLVMSARLVGVEGRLVLELLAVGVGVLARVQLRLLVVRDVGHDAGVALHLLHLHRALQRPLGLRELTLVVPARRDEVQLNRLEHSDILTY